MEPVCVAVQVVSVGLTVISVYAVVLRKIQLYCIIAGSVK